MTVADFYRALWRHRLFIIVATVGLGAAAFFLTSRQTKLYTASTLVRIQQKITNSGEAFGALQTGERLARTYATIVQTRTIADRVSRSLGSSVPRSEIAIHAGQLPNLELLRISVTNVNPFRATQIANAVPTALSGFISDTGTLRDEVVTIERASVPDTPSSPNVPLTVALAVIVGIVLNSGLAVLYEAFAGRFRTVDDAERTGVPVLATIPALNRRRSRGKSKSDPPDGELEDLFSAPHDPAAGAPKSRRRTARA